MPPPNRRPTLRSLAAVPFRSASFALVALVLVACREPVAPPEWPRFRGPNGGGILEAPHLPVEFGPEKNVVWRHPVPTASSSPVLAGRRVFLAAADANDLIVECVAFANGQRLWERRLKRARIAQQHANNDSAAATPVTDGQSVYVFFQELGLVCFDRDGAQRWLLPLGPFHNQYGMAASPILANGALLLLCDQESGSFLLAVDAATGVTRWKRVRENMNGSWTTPVLFPSVADARQVITFGNFVAHGYDLPGGEPAWYAIGHGVCPVSSPIVADDRVFMSSPYPAEIAAPTFDTVLGVYDTNQDGKIAQAEFGHPMFAKHFQRLDSNEDGFVDRDEWEGGKATLGGDDYGLVAYEMQGGKAKEVWRERKAIAAVGTPLVYRGVLYVVKDGGILSALDPATGAVYKRERIPGVSGDFFPSAVAGDGRVYVPSNLGQIAVIAAGRDWHVLAVNDMNEEIRATPAIGPDGSLFVRTKAALYRLRQP